MRYYEVGYDVGDGITSVNVIQAIDEEACKMEAETHADRFGYGIMYMVEIGTREASERLRKGMPIVVAKGLPKEEHYYSDFYGSTASIKKFNNMYHLTVRLSNGDLYKEKDYETFKSARIALGKMGEGWREKE